MAEKLDEREIVRRVLLPPDDLLDMRNIYAGMRPETAAQRILALLLKEDAGEFIRRRQALEKDYRELILRYDSGSVEKPDVGSEALGTMVQEWMKEWQKKRARELG